jgi:hypothetical protein
MPAARRYRWFVVGVFFCFMLLHQTDRLLLGPLTTPIMTTFGIDEVAMGAVFAGALLIDRFAFFAHVVVFVVQTPTA